jgi:hypothetical protein
VLIAHREEKSIPGMKTKPLLYHENNAAFFIAFRPATNHHHGETVASTVGSAT